MTVAYWVFTVLLVVAAGGSGVADLMEVPEIKAAVVDTLQYPPYFLRLLGMWKLIGVAIVILPGLQRLKEWAYGGFLACWLTAAFSHIYVGDTAGSVAPFALFVITLLSWALRPESRKLAAADTI